MARFYYTPEQAIKAINALLTADFDNPILPHPGSIRTELLADIAYIISITDID